jgi:hypothetical protein
VDEIPRHLHATHPNHAPIFERLFETRDHTSRTGACAQEALRRSNTRPASRETAGSQTHGPAGAALPQ